MKINRNMSAVMTNKQLLRTENKLAASMERLSSGLKINHAGDNPAGIAISNKMRAQIDALDQAENNVKDGISVLQIADGALNEVNSMIQRMRELSVQAANGTNSFSDKQSIQMEIDQLSKEVGRISSNTEYNTKTLLDGSSDVRVYSDNAIRMSVSDRVIPGDYHFSVDSLATKAEISFDISGWDPATAGQTAEGGVYINGIGFNFGPEDTKDEIIASFKTIAEEIGASMILDGDKITIEQNRAGSAGELSIQMDPSIADLFGGAAGYELKEDGYHRLEAGEDAVITLDTNDFTANATYLANGDHIKIRDNDGFEMDFMVTKTGNTKLDVTDIGPLTIQLGANQYQTMDVRIPEVSQESLYLDTVDVSVVGGAEYALNTLDDALARLNEARSRIGAFQNRLEYAQSSLAETHENLTSAYSTILDTDMAEEMTEYTQTSILDQATISVLSQANDLPQTVLSMLQ